MWTVVGGDPVPMRRGDFLPQAGWNWHAHHNATAEPMAWIDGLDIPFQYATEAQFFEFGRDEISDAERITPERSRSERLWGHPGLRPVGVGRGRRPARPLLAYRWEHTDRALADQLALEAEGYGGTVEPGHAAVRFTNPADRRRRAADDPRRDAPDRAAAPRPPRCARSARRSTRCSTAPGTVTVGDRTWTVTRGDLFVVPSWQPLSVRSEAGATDSDSGALDLFRFSDAPIFEALHLDRTPYRRRPPDEARHPPRRRRRPGPSGSTATGSSTSASPTSARCSRQAGWPERAGGRDADGHAVPGRRRRLRPGRAAPVQGRLRRPQLPQPHPGDGARPARRTRRCSPSSPTPSSAPTTTIVRPDETDAARLGGRARRGHRRAGPPRRRARRPRPRSPASPSLNDVTCRDWQFRTREWLQGKIWDSTTPVGPYLVTPDELPGGVRPALDVCAQRRRRGDAVATTPATCCSTRSRWCSTSRPWSASTPATSSPPARPAASATPATPSAT